MSTFTEFLKEAAKPLNEAEATLRGTARETAIDHIRSTFREYGIKGLLKFVDNKSNFISRAEVPIRASVFGVLASHVSEAKILVTESFFNTGGKKTVYTVELSFVVGNKEVTIELHKFTVNFKTMGISTK